MTTITAKIIADSISVTNDRITTLQLRYPRFIHAEFLTHRQFSRNSQSNRAIPFRDVVQDVLDDTAVPLHWGKEQKGMVASEEVIETYWCEEDWLDARDQAIKYAARLHEELGVHKQICNRLLEPFQHINTLVTATDWDNFFKLRLAPDAEPHIQLLAKAIKDAMDNSTPRFVYFGEWHTPYVDDPNTSVKVSVARCARVSYNNHGKVYPELKEHEFADRLLEHGHMSPFEHVATPSEGYPANFSGWMSYRYWLEQ